MDYIQKIPNKLFGTTNTHHVTNCLVVKYNLVREWLTEFEYEILLEDIENARIEGNRKYGYGRGPA